MSGEKGDIVQFKFKFQIPDVKLLYILSKKHDHLSFQIHSMLPIGKRQGNNIVNVEGRGAQSILVDLKKKFPDLSYSVLFKSPESVLLNIIMEDPWILDKIVETGIPLQYPIGIKDGVASIELITERNKIDLFLEELEHMEIDYTIKSIGRYQNFPLLTDIQKIY